MLEISSQSAAATTWWISLVPRLASVAEQITELIERAIYR